MVRKCFFGVVLGVVTGLVGFTFVGDAHGFLNCLQNRYNAAAAMYGGNVCNPCGQQTTCNYVPQTCYRVQYVNVPVTTYRPVASCDPCSGCQTVCMKPVTCYQQRAQYVPYTTYRLVYSVSQPACATTAYYPTTVAAAAPAAVAVAAPAGCSSCNAGAATTYYGATTSYGAAPSYSAPTATVAPALTTTAAPSFTYNYPSGAGYNARYNYAPPAGTAVVTTTTAPNVVNYGVPVNPTPAYTTPNPVTTYASPPAGVMYSTPPSGAVITQTSAVISPSTQVTTGFPPIQTYNYGTPTPAPVETKVESKTEVQTQKPAADDLTPIPDPVSEPTKPEGPNLNPTSTPRLFDPQDKTAAAWPTQRAWGYAPIGVRTASLTDVAPPAAAPVTLGPIVPHAAPQVARPTVDADGWQASGR